MLTFISEPECCDGTDEAPGVCKNACKEIGQAYRERVRAEQKLRKTVSTASSVSPNGV